MIKPKNKTSEENLSVIVIKMTSKKESFPEGVSATFADGVLTVTGPKGSVTRHIHTPKILVKVESDGVTFTAPVFTKREKKMMQTFLAHFRNACKGVIEGHTYKLRVCSGHFPMNVSVKGQNFEVKNFIGEAVPRNYVFSSDVEVKLEGDIITVSGVNKELVAQTAASIEQLTRRNGFDRRIFQDGIYITEKDGKSLMVTK